MNRREALQQVSLLLGGTMIGAQAFLSSSFTFPKNNDFLNPGQKTLLNEVGETIFPATDTPGAKEADVASFMSVIVADCYTPAEQKVFLGGIEKLEKASQDAFGRSFLNLKPAERETLLSAIDKEHLAYMAARKSGEPVHYFRMFKELTISGYMTSEVGATSFLKYNPAPGRYDGCTTEKPWH